jgi:hypothetical protein
MSHVFAYMWNLDLQKTYDMIIVKGGCLRGNSVWEEGEGNGGGI